MNKKTNKYLLTAVLVSILFHLSAFFFTLESTYDALIHLFFAEHYASSWFDPWSYKWYTGFSVMGYPPLVHQSIGALSLLVNLKFGLFAMATIATIIFITGVYKFSLLITANRKVAGYSAILAVFSSSFLETLHVFGQLPSITGIGLLMHGLPEIYLWVKSGKRKNLIASVLLIAVTVTSHHVTPIFGMVFFIFPLLGTVVMDCAKEEVNGYKEISFGLFLQNFKRLFWRIVGFGGASLFVIIFSILPYWITTKNDPISQVPIPHGSRDNFLEVTSSGLVFFLIPWGVLLLIWPYLFYRYFSKRYLFFGLSFSLLTLLGTGGTTPLPKMLLGDTAFNILTLDRFTLWASIMALPIFGEFAYRFIEADFKTYLQQKYSALMHRITAAGLIICFIGFAIFTMSLGYFRPLQPQKIKTLPIVNFLIQDHHDQWRYMTLGFGDQMAWLSAQTNALSVDGNYHSARRIPELTTRAVERLENSKFRGIEGIGSLQQFLTVPEKYNLKFIFSNDKFYDPILYFCGWRRLSQLENGIMVWEKQGVAPLSAILPKKDAPKFQKILWGSMPFFLVLLTLLFYSNSILKRIFFPEKRKFHSYLKFGVSYKKRKTIWIAVFGIWLFILLLSSSYGAYTFYIKNTTQLRPENVVKAYYDALDFKQFKRAYSYINPDQGIALDQYMLEIAVTDGLLNSYAKLNSIHVKTIRRKKNTAILQATLDFTTPLKNIRKTKNITTVYKNKKWYIQKEKLSNALPPDQLQRSNYTHFYNQGRRKISTQQTYHEDVLKQPVLEILSAKLVQKDNEQYAIIGELQNVDNFPADVSLKAVLYDKNNTLLAQYNAMYIIKHKIMPKETTSFRIDFQGIAWSKKGEKIPENFNPEEFTPITLKNNPVSFVLHSQAHITNTDLYKNVALRITPEKDSTLQTSVFNYGTQEITIPQLIVSYYDKDKKLLWVEQQFLQEGVRAQRQAKALYTPTDVSCISVIKEDITNCLVNGLPNKSISAKNMPDRILEHQKKDLLKVQSKDYTYLKIQINNYIGNPK